MSGGFKLISYLRNYRRESIIGPLFKLLEATFELIVPLLMAYLIDVGVRQADGGVILRTGALMVGMGLMGLICSLTAQYFAAKASMGFGTELRSALFRHIGRLSFAEIDGVGASTLITRVTSDIDRAQAGVNLVLRLFLRSPFIVVGALAMALTIDRSLSLIFLAATPVIALVIYGVMARSLPGYKRIQAQLDQLSLIARENLRGVRVIRAFSRQRDEAERFDREAAQMMRAQLMVGRIAALNNPLTYALVNLSIIAILWFGGYRVTDGAITQGQLIALINYMSQILLALVALANLIVVFAKALASGSRIDDLFKMSHSISDEGADSIPAVPGAPRLAFENVSFGYPGAQGDALSDVTFRAMPGQTVGIIGGTGAGKSTLVGLIPRFYDVGAGRISVDGVNIRDYRLAALRKKIGMAPQRAVLFAGTIRDNLRWGKADATDQELWRALAIAQAADFVSARPEGLDAPIEQGGVNLSGGQRQRLTIARALVGQPDILILDDSASALDFATDARLRRALRDEAQGMTVLVVSQRAAAIRNADLILVLDDGKVVAQGTHEDLYAQSDSYREICLSQLTQEEAAT